MDVDRTSTGDIQYPEDIWKAARPLARPLADGDIYPSVYDHAMAISALLLAERQRCAKICRDMAAGYEAGKEESVDWKARASELRWVAGLIDGSAPPPDVRSAP